MRVTTLQTSRTMLDYMTSAQTKYYELSQEASSGKKISKPSDDPLATKAILSTNTKLSELNTYLSNMKTAGSELSTVDSTLNSLTNLIGDASDYATQAATGTYNTDDLATIKSQIDSIIDSTIDLANTQFNGTYVFSGTATAQETYSINSSTGSIDYNGTNSSEYQRYVSISEGVSVGVNANGRALFGSYTVTSGTAATVPGDVAGTTVTTGIDADGNNTTTTTTVTLAGGNTTTSTTVASGLLGTLKTLSNALGTNPQTADSKAAISSSIDNLETNLDTVTANRTKLAAVSNRFDMTSDSINQTVVNLKSYRSDLQDADLAEVLTDLATSKSALEATYSVTSQMLSKTSLLDYM